jgi:hypothetical protein
VPESHCRGQRVSRCCATPGRQELAKLQEAQRLFDSPDEHAGNLVACHCEIPRLLAAVRR